MRRLLPHVQTHEVEAEHADAVDPAGRENSRQVPEPGRVKPVVGSKIKKKEIKKEEKREKKSEIRQKK